MQKELDGQITESEATELNVHIEDCSDCYENWQGFKAVRNLMRDDKPVEPPPDLASRLMVKLDRTPKVGFVEGYVVPFFLQNRIRLAMASFILILAGFGLMFNFYQKDNSLGGLFDNSPSYSEATIGVRTPGRPIYIIPADDDQAVIDENNAAIEDLEKILEGNYRSTDIHLASD